VYVCVCTCVYVFVVCMCVCTCLCMCAFAYVLVGTCAIVRVCVHVRLHYLCVRVFVYTLFVGILIIPQFKRRAVPVIPEMAADVNTSVFASRVAENEVLLLDAVNADAGGLVPSVLLVNAVSATIEGSEGSVFAALAVLEVDGDKLLDSAGAGCWLARVLAWP